MSYLLLLSAAFFASLSHCVGMCGGIVVGLNMRQFDDSKILQTLANILYFCGRMCGYMVIGLCFVLIGKSFGFNETSKAIIFIALGILLFITALIITFYPKMLGNVTPSGNYTWYKKAFHKALHSKNIFGFFIVGILNGFLPCHLVYMFAIKAADSLSVWHSILSMFIFSLGTFLPLFLVGCFSQQFFSSRFRRFFLYIAFIVMSYFALNNIYKGVQLLQHNDTMQHHNMIHIQDNETIQLESNYLESNPKDSDTLDSKPNNENHNMQHMQHIMLPNNTENTHKHH